MVPFNIAEVVDWYKAISKNDLVRVVLKSAGTVESACCHIRMADDSVQQVRIKQHVNRHIKQCPNPLCVLDVAVQVPATRQTRGQWNCLNTFFKKCILAQLDAHQDLPRGATVTTDKNAGIILTTNHIIDLSYGTKTIKNRIVKKIDDSLNMILLSDIAEKLSICMQNTTDKDLYILKSVV